jgi:phosphatidylethanolamine/phosphatidyl-N-methylethanolamine N-methyltransferase
MAMRSDPNYEQYLARWAEIYETKSYEQGLAGYFLKKSHEWAERSFGPETHFSKVLEVGAGTGIHLRYVRHSFDEYWVTDLIPSMVKTLEELAGGGKKGKIFSQKENATSLSFADKTFDRLIAAHVLEHLQAPHDVLREWVRVVKPGGTISLLLPCDPGIAWRLGRHFGVRKKFSSTGFEYDYFQSREHVNPINNLVSFIRFYFPNAQESWLPCRVPSMDINLFYVANITV